MEKDYDEDLLSRQLGVYGKETMGKLANMKVLLIGMRGLGVEVAKNLILAGPKRVDILDPKKVHIRDLSANFYVKESDALKHRRDRACVKRLAELNPYVKVSVVGDADEEAEEEDASEGERSESDGDQEENSEDEGSERSDTPDEESKEEWSEDEASREPGSSGAESRESASEERSEEKVETSSAKTKEIKINKALIKKYDVVVVTEILKDIEDVIAINEICREVGAGFILSENLGAYGYAFVDFGNSFMCRDKTGEEHKSFNVVGITNAKQGEVTVHKGKIHSFSDGDYVVFREVQGMTELNERSTPIRIKVIDVYTFKLELDTTKFGKYKREGIVQSVSVPEKIEFQSLKDSLKNPNKVGPGFFNTVDLSCFGRPEQLHIGLQAIYRFQVKNKRLPKNKRADVHEVVKNAKEINSQYKKDKNAFSVDKLEDKIIKLMAKFSRNQICPLTSFFGGIVAQEVVKYTGKFTPLPGN